MIKAVTLVEMYFNGIELKERKNVVFDSQKSATDHIVKAMKPIVETGYQIYYQDECDGYPTIWFKAGNASRGSGVYMTIQLHREQGFDKKECVEAMRNAAKILGL